jgi:hypothetical protein
MRPVAGSALALKARCSWLFVILFGKDSLKRKFFLLCGCLLLLILLVRFLISDLSSCIICFCIYRPIMSLIFFWTFVKKCNKIMSVCFAVSFVYPPLQFENLIKVFHDDVILGLWVNSDNKNGDFTWRAKCLSILTQSGTHYTFVQPKLSVSHMVL